MQMDHPTEPWMPGRIQPPAATPGTLPPGSVLAGRYQIESALGQGGMGIVYRARDLQADRRVAIKFFFAPPGVEEGARRFQREFRALTRLQHPRIVQVFDYGQAGDMPFYVMEFIAGADLSGLRRARGGRLSVRETIAVGLQLCDALAYIHGQGVIHRDLKPSNVMIEGSDDSGANPDPHSPLSNIAIKLVDFGLVKLSEVSAELTQSGMMLGTASYMSPEQAQALPIDTRSDLYSLGVLFYELLTGQLPFTADTPIAVILQHITQNPVPLHTLDAAIPREFETLVLALLAKRPAERPSSAEAVLGALTSLTSLAAPAPVELAASPRADAVFRAGLIGRRTEMERLNHYLDQAWAGEGQLVVIEGEAGVGKTRLAAELGGQARLRGGLRLVGTCHETERVPYGPVAEWFNDIFRLSQDFGSIISGLEPELARLVPRLIPFTPPPPGDAIEPEQAKLRFFDAVMRALGRLSERKPLMLLLDDLQWADEATLELLHYLVRNARGQRLISGQVVRDKTPPERADLVQLRQMLARHFNEGELRDLCFDLRNLYNLDLDYSSLPGQGKGDKARELVAYLDRRHRVDELMTACRKLRPELDWGKAGEETLIPPRLVPERLNRIFICATTRSEECDESGPLAALQRDLSRLRLLERIRLERLSSQAASELVAALLGVDQAPPQLAERIYTESEGNPFFIEETLKALAAEGLLVRQDGRWRLQADLGLTMLRIPSTIVDVVERRLARLADADRNALNWAAVLGHEFAYNVLQAASEIEEDALLDALDNLLRDQLIVEVRDPRQDRYRFTHGKINEVIYGALSNVRRKKMHRSAGQAIEKIYAARLEEMSPMLARHFTQGGDAPKAIQYNVQAGDRARKVYANQEAIAFYRQAVELAGDETQVEHQIAAHQGLGEVYHLIGEYEQAAASFRAVIDMAPQVRGEERERRRLLAQAWRGVVQASEARSDYDEALRACEQGLSLVGISNREEWARLLNGIGWIYIRKGDYEQARRQCEQAIELARDNPAIVATAYGYLGNAAEFSDYEQAVTYHRESLALWEKIGDKSRVARELNYLGNLAEARGMYDDAIREYQKSLALCREIGHSLGTAALLNNLGVIYQNRGQLELARDHFQQGLEIYQRIGSKEGVAITYGNLAEIGLASGEIDQALAYLCQAESINEEIGDRYGLSYTWMLMAEARLAEGHMDEARNLALRALELAAESGIKLQEGKAHHLLARLFIQSGQTDEARRHLLDACAIFEAIGKQDDLIRARDLLQKSSGN